ncbi:MAG: hypothetical protein OEM98_15155 [Gammaproteobacteria bacterium]|nr:hypothetical protein [Gammaproteobacteria bacterium]
MKQNTRYSLIVVALFGVAVLSPQALAQAVLKNSEHSLTVIPAEGNGRCSDYGANNFVKEMGTNISCPSAGGTVVGPDGKMATWSYDCGTGELSFSAADVGINYTVTKTSRNITWYPYGPATIVGDSRLTNQDPATGDILQMSSFALCYGLPDTDNVSESEPFPDCSTVENGWLGGIDCGALADGTVVTLWRPTDGNDEFFQCVCNDGLQASTVSCDPTGVSGDLPACYTKDVGQPKATTIVEFDADPVTCTTSGGTRTCKCVDNPFLPGNDCL